MDEFTAKLYEVYGLEAPADGENEQEIADPAAGDESVPAPEDGADDLVEEGENEQDLADPDADEEKPVQSREERARNAARRRKAAMDAAVEAARKEERQQYDTRMKNLLARAGFKNGDKPIENLDELESYMAEADAARIQKELAAGKLTPETLQSVVEQAVAKAGLSAPGEAAPAAQPPEEDAQAAFQAKVDAEFAEIRKYDPSIQGVADLMKLERADAIRDQIYNHGHSFEEAYKFVYADMIAAKGAAEQARHRADRVRGKDHMTPHKPTGDGDAAVPADVMRRYRQLMPKVSDEEIRKHYNNFKRDLERR